MSKLERLVTHRCQRPAVEHFWGHYQWTCPDCRSEWTRMFGIWACTFRSRLWVAERWQS